MADETLAELARKTLATARAALLTLNRIHDEQARRRAPRTR